MATPTEPKSPPSPLEVVVASKNPVKINATLQGFSLMFPLSTFTTIGVSVPSGVPEQPFSDAETLLGAQNRVKNAREAQPEADYWIGLEGGVDEDGGALRNFAWIVVTDKHGRTGKARTGAYYLPEETAKLVREGMELGHADDIVFGRSNSKQKTGSVGLLTDDVIDRTGYYIQAVILALIPFKNPTLTF
ncbi:hypothetical protein jhhlp_004842 [Lomentospora prolificans]|uniref:inosine/xanthosine triphosphatase n=1 Tax=Lomentospora prolificans TaxID=41688 RepID=A0A2N3N7N3_9PEZI|nr:hypothetical protein jhhlp_004842 [Lomentospora prolificans]